MYNSKLHTDDKLHTDVLVNIVTYNRENLKQIQNKDMSIIF